MVMSADTKLFLILLLCIFVIIYYVTIIITNIQIIKRKNKTSWLILCILSYIPYLFWLGIIFLITYWFAGKNSKKDDELRQLQIELLKKKLEKKEDNINVELKGKIRKLK